MRLPSLNTAAAVLGVVILAATAVQVYAVVDLALTVRDMRADQQVDSALSRAGLYNDLVCARTPSGPECQAASRDRDIAIRTAAASLTTHHWVRVTQPESH